MNLVLSNSMKTLCSKPRSRGDEPLLQEIAGYVLFKTPLTRG